MSAGEVPTIIWNGIHYEIEAHKSIAMLPPEENIQVVTAIFFNKEGHPTHVANWPKQAVVNIIRELQENLKHFA